MSLWSSDNPYHLCEPRAVGESNFANRSFSYVAPKLYSKLSLSLKQIESVDTLKKQLKSSSFLGLTICLIIQFVKNTHYNLWFASFELFSSAYEFQNV